METAIQPHDFVNYVSRLEAQNRRLKWTGICLFTVLFLAIGLLGWQVWRVSHPSFLKIKMISAEQFTVLDSKGQIQGALLGMADGANLFLSGTNGKTALTFLPGDSDHPGATLTLSGNSGTDGTFPVQSKTNSSSIPLTWKVGDGRDVSSRRQNSRSIPLA